jgi:5,5'-dehydrodivanillate O-demethylase
MYHGWKYSGHGHCIERPAEGDAPLDGIRIAGYPAKEYCGFVFAYLGEGAAPAFELPRRNVYEAENTIRLTRREIWPCNWFQQVENTMDAVHVSFVHQYGNVGAFGRAVTESLPKMEYVEIDSGLRQIATRSANNVRVGDFTFPNNNNVVLPNFDEDGPWQNIAVWVVPNDDTSTTRFMLHCVPSRSAEADARAREHFRKYADYSPAQHHVELFRGDPLPEDPVIQITSAQDYIAMVGQGAIVDRTRERLGKSDVGIAKLRRIFFRELDALQEGTPLKEWKSVPTADWRPTSAKA